MLNESQKTEIEKMIDAHGLDDVLMAVSHILFEKAEHIAISYNDTPLARKWESAGEKIAVAMAGCNVG